MGSDYTIKKVGIIGYYTTQCVLLVAFTKLLYANDLKQRWAKILLYKVESSEPPLWGGGLFSSSCGGLKGLLDQNVILADGWTNRRTTCLRELD